MSALTHQLIRRASYVLREPPQIIEPIFIAGTVRSGSTVLSQVLGRHPDLHHRGFEQSNQWVRYTSAALGVPGCGCGCPAQTDEDISDEQREAARRRFARYLALAGQPERTRWLTKNPHFCNKLRLLHAVFPDTRLIVTTRDIRSTAASIKGLWEYTLRESRMLMHLPEDPTACWRGVPEEDARQFDPKRTFPGGDAWVLAEYWLRMHEAMDRDMDVFDSIVLVRHQNFVTDPDGTIARVAEGVGLEHKPFELPVKIQPSRNQRWKTILNENERRDLERFIEAHAERIARLRSGDTTV